MFFIKFMKKLSPINSSLILLFVFLFIKNDSDFELLK